MALKGWTWKRVTARWSPLAEAVTEANSGKDIAMARPRICLISHVPESQDHLSGVLNSLLK